MPLRVGNFDVFPPSPNQTRKKRPRSPDAIEQDRHVKIKKEPGLRAPSDSEQDDAGHTSFGHDNYPRVKSVRCTSRSVLHIVFL